MAITADQPISVGNLAAYHDAVWGGLPPRQLVFCGEPTYQIMIPSSFMSQFSSLIVGGIVLNRYVSGEVDFTLGNKLVGGRYPISITNYSTGMVSIQRNTTASETAMDITDIWGVV